MVVFDDYLLRLDLWLLLGLGLRCLWFPDWCGWLLSLD